MVHLLLLGMCLLLSGAIWPANAAHAQQRTDAINKGARPNIVFILADDLGYGDLGSYGQRRVATPHLDRMAQEGVRFTQFYAGNTVCAPSRWALMTGRDMGHSLVRANGGPPLSPRQQTVASLLQEAGYTTGIFGKWGLGGKGTTGAPQKQGFDEFYGYLEHVHAHEHYTDHLWETTSDTLRRVPIDTTQYVPHLITQKALDFIDRHKEEPFFLYVPYTLVHAALSVPQKAKAEFMRKGDSVFFAENAFPCCGVIGTYRAQPHPKAAYAAMLKTLDQSVGRLLNGLRSHGLGDNTIVLFTSDNGPHTEGGAAPGFFESNGPLRGLKRDLFEGGIRVPMIAWGPGHIPSGQTSDQVWAMWDFLPTAAEWAGTRPPSKVEGISMVSALTGRGRQRDHEYLYWEFKSGWGGEYVQAIRRGKWKLLRIFTKEGDPQLRLHNLETDVGEYENVAQKHPDIVEHLSALIKEARTEPELERFRNPYRR